MARPTDSPTTPPMVIRDLDGLLSAVPALLGFHPAESAVFICLAGPNRRLGPVVRADLPADSSPYAFFDAVVQLVGNTRRHADQVVIVFYTDQPDVIDLGVVWETVGKPWDVGVRREVRGERTPTGHRRFRCCYSAFRACGVAFACGAGPVCGTPARGRRAGGGDVIAVGRCEPRRSDRSADAGAGGGGDAGHRGSGHYRRR